MSKFIQLVQTSYGLLALDSKGQVWRFSSNAWRLQHQDRIGE